MEDSGERVFNQYYKKSALIICYCAIVVVFSGCLAVTAFYNLINENDCSYVVFVYLYVVVQVAPVVLLIKWLVEYCMLRHRGVLDPNFRIDNFVQPMTRDLVQDPTKCQVRCF
jgi:hypothetical protein